MRHNKGFEQGTYLLQWQSLYQIGTTQMCKCKVKIPHLRQMPLPKVMLLGSTPHHISHPPPTWEGGTKTVIDALQDARMEEGKALYITSVNVHLEMGGS